MSYPYYPALGARHAEREAGAGYQGQHPGMLHVGCPFTGAAQCYCAPGAAAMSAHQQAAMSGEERHQLYETWKERAEPDFAAQLRNEMQGGAQGSEELLLPRMYRNPRAVNINGDTPVMIDGHEITSNHARAQVEDAMQSARHAALKAAQLCADAGMDFNPPAELGVDLGSIKRMPDVQLLLDIEAGGFVKRAEQNELSAMEEQQLLGLNPEQHDNLKGAQQQVQDQNKHKLQAIRQRFKQQFDELQAQQQRISETAQALASQGSDAAGTEAARLQYEPERFLVKMRDLSPSLKGQKLMFFVQEQSQWFPIEILDISVEECLVRAMPVGTTKVLNLKLDKYIHDGHLAFSQEEVEQRMAAHQRQRQPQDAGAPGHASGSGSQSAQPLKRQGSRDLPRPAFGGSMIDIFMGMGPQAQGTPIEVHLLSSGQKLRASISFVDVADRSVVVTFDTLNGQSSKLRAADEFKAFAIRMM